MSDDDEKMEKIRSAAAILTFVLYGVLYIMRMKGDDRMTDLAEYAAVESVTMMDAACD